MKEKSVLVIEDDQDIRENLVEALQAEGYLVFQAEHGQSAIDFLEAVSSGELPGVIILDLMMPVMDGRSFLNHIQSSKPKFAHIPVIVSTAVNSADYPVSSLEGVAEKLKKPVDLEKLYSSVSKHCRA